MAHESLRGDYYDRQRRNATRVEATTLYTREIAEGRRAHLIKAGGVVSGVAVDALNQSAAVRELRSDGSLARLIAFDPATDARLNGYELAAFAQDAWTLAPAVTVDLGVRYDAATVAGQGRIAPRAGVTWAIDSRTTLSGGAGIFTDKVLLAAAAFPSLPARTVTEYDSVGVPIDRVTYDNVLAGRLRMPWARAWHAELDRRFASGTVVRVKYQDRMGRDEPVIDVDRGADGVGALAVSSRGGARSRSLETTVGLRSSPAGQSIYVSYVRASATGNLNDFASIAGNFREPFVQPDQVGPIAVDVPHRLLAWGVIKLPSQITLAPFFELRDGFPYSAIDDEWRYVGQRNSERLPAFASLDLFVNKIVDLPGRLPLARVGLKLYNLTGATNARDVQRDVARPDFGATYNPIPREVRGVFELMWGK
jgi:outer membrane receptor protein involved in Fe transport